MLRPLRALSEALYPEPVHSSNCENDFVMSASQSADQGKIGRVVGLSLAGLWLAVSMMAAIADTTEAENTADAAIESSEFSADIIAANN